MTSTPQQLPRTLEAAHAVIATLSEKLSQTVRENEFLKQKIDKLCRRLFHAHASEEGRLAIRDDIDRDTDEDLGKHVEELVEDREHGREREVPTVRTCVIEEPSEGMRSGGGGGHDRVPSMHRNEDEGCEFDARARSCVSLV